MNYIYDVLCNFHPDYYEFYDWNKTDDIIRIRKTPIIRVDESTYNNLKNNKVKVEKEFLNSIYNKTEVFKNKYIDKLAYTCIISSMYESFFIKFDSNGYNILKSSMLIDEEREVLEDISLYNLVSINYEVLEVNSKSLCTRNEEFYINKIKRIIDDFYNNKEYEKLKYLYYECFNTNDDDFIKIKKDLINSLNDYKNIRKINDVIKLLNA